VKGWLREATGGKKLIGYLLLDVGEIETDARGRGLHELELMSRVGG
jgi:hypothetical protein